VEPISGSSDDIRRLLVPYSRSSVTLFSTPQGGAEKSKKEFREGTYPALPCGVYLIFKGIEERVNGQGETRTVSHTASG
jgi:hypothetical protein